MFTLTTEACCICGRERPTADLKALDTHHAGVPEIWACHECPHAANGAASNHHPHVATNATGN